MSPVGSAGIHGRGEAFEQVVAVLRPGAGFGMILNRKDGAVFHPDSAIRSVEQAHMGFLHALRQALAVDGEAVVHRRDLDLAGLQILDGMVRTVMPMVHLDRARAQCEGKHLVAEADAENRHVGPVEHASDHRNRVISRGRRVTRPVRQE